MWGYGEVRTVIYGAVTGDVLMYGYTCILMI